MSSPPLPWAHRCLAVVLLGSPACGDGELESVGPGGDGATTAAPAPVEPVPDTTGEAGDTTGLPSLFLGHPDFGDGHACSVEVQDCPGGMKCMLYASMGGTWDSTGCFPIASDPDAVGEPCTVEVSGGSGIDTCELGAMCWDVNPETLTGECVPYCTGTPGESFCEDPGFLCAGRLPICLPTCCPVEQDCAEGNGCYPVGRDFTCAPNAAPDSMYADACEFLNVCPPGMYCANPEIGLDCDEGGQGCCLPFCSLGSDDCAAFNSGYECLPWYEPGAAPPGFERTGFCSAVQE